MNARGFQRIKEYYDRIDMELIQRKGLSVWGTAYGLYGASDLRVVYELFKTIRLDRAGSFVDLGSGDGRIVLLASLFTASTGIEGDPFLHGLAGTAREMLGTSCTLTNADYTREDLSGYDVLFIYADHNWPDAFQEKLMRECRGTLYSLHNTYRPGLLRRGRTFWIGQVPFVSYAFTADGAGVGASAHDASSG